MWFPSSPRLDPRRPPHSTHVSVRDALANDIIVSLVFYLASWNLLDYNGTAH